MPNTNPVPLPNGIKVPSVDYLLDSDGSPLGVLKKAGTPVNNQIGVWTDSRTLEGSDDLSFDSTTGLTLKKDLSLGELGNPGHIHLNDGADGVGIELDASPGRLDIDADVYANTSKLVSTSGLLAARRRHTEPDTPETDWCELPGFVNRTSPPTLFLNSVLQEYGKIYSGYAVNT